MADLQGRDELAYVASARVAPAVVIVPQNRLKLVIQPFLTLHTPGPRRHSWWGGEREVRLGERRQAAGREMEGLVFQTFKYPN